MHDDDFTPKSWFFRENVALEKRKYRKSENKIKMQKNTKHATSY
jgi:hypothetical protein